MKDDSLWNAEVNLSDYATEKQAYQQAIMEQYKLYVEMADRISGRRNVTNTFFLSFNAAFLAISATILGSRQIAIGWLLFPIIALIVQCVIWFFLIRSYRLLNSRKYRLIGQLEEKLPALLWKAEWIPMTQQAGLLRFWRFSLLEQWTPVLFAVIYSSGYLAYVLA
ncbi:hypothetical protein ABZW11_23025 [Nonomuraea sp. NPDC004580]|uniref:RipA family octameric membrane protein n=1 Tax=Nonomuraea sp. NPDC004580 TaxID=3154552 RepID=UPI0033A31F61